MTKTDLKMYFYIFKAILDLFDVFSFLKKISAISTDRTMKFGQSEYFYTKDVLKMHLEKCPVLWGQPLKEKEKKNRI